MADETTATTETTATPASTTSNAATALSDAAASATNTTATAGVDNTAKLVEIATAMAAGEMPKPESISDTATAGTETAGTEPAKADGAGAPNPSQVAPDAQRAASIDKARAALKRGQFPDDVIAGLPEDRVLELGTALATKQAEQDRLGNEADRLKRLVDDYMAQRTAAGAPAGTGDRTPAAPATDPAATNADPLNAFVESLRADELHADLAEPLQKALAVVRSESQKQIEAMQAAMQQQQAAYQAEINSFYLQQDRLLLQNAARELSAEIPQLKDPANLDTVSAKVYELAKLDSYHNADGSADVPRLVRDAASVLYGKDLRKQALDGIVKRQKAQLDGQPEIDRGGRQPGASLSFSEAAAEAIRQLQAGKPPEEINAALSSRRAV